MGFRRLAPLALVVFLLLSACGKKGEFEPPEVLRRAIVASQQLQSAKMSVEITGALHRAGIDGTFQGKLGGLLGHGGQQLSFSLTGDGSFGQAEAQTEVHVQADVVAEPPSDTYVLVREFTVDPPQPALEGIAGMIGSWWKMPGAANAEPSPPLTPDPLLLKSQAEVIVVTEDHGLQKVRGREAYFYSVTLDEDKMLEFLRRSAEQKGRPFDRDGMAADLRQYDIAGQLWVDAQTFYVSRLQWTLRSRADAGKSVYLELQAELADHDSAPPITPPKTFQELPPGGILEQMMRTLPLQS